MVSEMVSNSTISCTKLARNVTAKQAMWAHDSCLLFWFFWTHNFLPKHAMAMNISAHVEHVFGIIIQVLECKYSVSVLRYYL